MHENSRVAPDRLNVRDKSNVRNSAIPLLLALCILGSSLLGGFITILPAMADGNIIFTDSNSTSVQSSTDSTTVTVSSNLSVANPGSSVIFTVTVSDTSSPSTVPTGAVSWSDNGAGGTFSPSSCILASGSCTTSYTIATNSPSTVTMTASYGGDSIHTTSSGVSTLTINHLNPTRTTITPNSAVLPSNRTLTFTVQTSDTSGSPTTLSGTVSFNDNNNGGTFNPASCTLPSVTCVTTYTSPANPLNVITINATYSGDSTHSSSSSISQISTSSTSPTLTNGTDATTMSVTSNSVTFTPGSPIVVTASVTDTSNPSSSMIGITSWSDNGAGGIFSPNLCLLSNNKCALTYTPSASTSSGITITATYAGDSTHSGSSGTLSLSLLSSPTSSPQSQAPSTQSSPSTPSSPPPSSSTPSTEQPTPPASSQSSSSSSSPVPSVTTTPSVPSAQSSPSTSSSPQSSSPVSPSSSTPSSPPPTSSAKSQTPSSPSTSTPSGESSNAALPSSNQPQTSSAAVVHQVVNMPEEIFSKAISVLEGFFHKL